MRPCGRLAATRFLRMQDRVRAGGATGFTGEELSGLAVVKIYTRYLAPVPGQIAIRERDAQGKNEDSVVLFTENGAWEITFRGARPLAACATTTTRTAYCETSSTFCGSGWMSRGLAFYSAGNAICTRTGRSRLWTSPTPPTAR